MSKGLLQRILAEEYSDPGQIEGAPRKSPQEKEALKEFSKPEMSEARLRIGPQRAYGIEGWVVTLTVPVSVEFLKAKNMDLKVNDFAKFGSSDPIEVLVMMVNQWLPERVGMRLGRPSLSNVDIQRQRAKGGVKQISMDFDVRDPIMAYALGVNLKEWHYSGEVPSKEEIAKRMKDAQAKAQEGAEVRKAIKSGGKPETAWKEFIESIEPLGMNYQIAKAIPVASATAAGFSKFGYRSNEDVDPSFDAEGLQVAINLKLLDKSQLKDVIGRQLDALTDMRVKCLNDLGNLVVVYPREIEKKADLLKYYQSIVQEELSQAGHVATAAEEPEMSEESPCDLKDLSHIDWMMKQTEAGPMSALDVKLEPNKAVITLVDPTAFEDYENEDKKLNAVEDELHERWMVNHGMSWIAPEDIGALTDAPMFGELDRADNGDVEAVHDLYYYNDYMLKDWRQELLDKGKVEFMKHHESNAAESGINIQTDLAKYDENGMEVNATGEPDGDYDTELFDAICNELKQHGYEADHKEFDKYQGVYIDVKKGGKRLAKFWTKDFYMTGETVKDPNVKYRKAVLIDHEGSELSANAGDYFMMQPNEVFEDMLLVLTDMQGNETEIENPKKADLPDLNEVSNNVQFKGQPDSVIVLHDEVDPDADLHVMVSADYKIVEADELLSYLSAKKPPQLDDVSTSKKEDEDKEVDAEAEQAESARPPETNAAIKTWGEAMTEAKKNFYPDAEKMLTKMSSMADKDGISRVNSDMTESYNDSDDKIEGIDLELPYWLSDENGDGSNYQKMVWTEDARGGQGGLAITSLRALGEIYPSVKDWMNDPKNAYISYGETSGMMPYHHSKYPDDSIIFNIEGVDTEEEVQYEVDGLAKEYKKDKDIDKFKSFLKFVSDNRLGTFYRYDGTSNNIEAYPRVQYNFACYFKLPEVLKVVNKARKSNKEETINQDQVKELIENIKEGAGDYK